MWPFIDDGASAVQFIMLVASAIMGVSHIVRPAMWVEFFGYLHAQGTRGVVTRTFMLELWPAMLIVTFHQVWWGPGIVLTIYGWAQLIKVTISMLMPEIGLRSLAMSQRGNRAFHFAGIALLVVGAFAGAALIWG
jgi:hypothetical protein